MDGDAGDMGAMIKEVSVIVSIFSVLTSPCFPFFLPSLRPLESFNFCGLRPVSSPPLDT
jgi:hypothetical protein